MASLADIYRPQDDPGSGSSRLLSARSGSLNATMSMMPRSGLAEPLVAGLAGAQAGQMEQDQSSQMKTQQFLSTFQKLAKVNKGFAVKFFNENGPEAGINSSIDGIDVQPDITSVHFENGYVAGVGPGGVYRPSEDGKGWQPVDQEWLDEFRQAAVDKQDSKNKSEKSLNLEAEYTKRVNAFNAALTREQKNVAKQALDTFVQMHPEFKARSSKEASTTAPADRPAPTF